METRKKNVVPLLDAQAHPEQIVRHDGHDNHIVKLDDDAIASVYPDSRVPKERKAQIKDILSSQGRLNSIRLYKCKLCESG